MCFKSITLMALWGAATTTLAMPIPQDQSDVDSSNNDPILDWWCQSHPHDGECLALWKRDGSEDQNLQCLLFPESKECLTMWKRKEVVITSEALTPHELSKREARPRKNELWKKDEVEADVDDDDGPHKYELWKKDEAEADVDDDDGPHKYELWKKDEGENDLEEDEADFAKPWKREE